MKKEDIKIGQFVYVIQKITGITFRWKVLGFVKCGYEDGVELEAADYSIYGATKEPLSRLYPTRDAAREAQDAERAVLKAKYREEIHSVEDLVRFMFDHTVSVCEEYTEYEAREVAIEKATEFGINLK